MQINFGRAWKQAAVAMTVAVLAVVGASMNADRPVAKAAGPTVQIDPTQLPLPVNANQVGKWAVSIIEAPLVGLAPGTAVGISGTPTVNWRRAPRSALPARRR